jgi:hypothetical protein
MFVNRALLSALQLDVVFINLNPHLELFIFDLLIPMLQLNMKDQEYWV